MVKLTQVDGNEVYFNFANIVAVRASGYGTTSIFTTECEDCEWCVNESLAEVVRRINVDRKGCLL